MEAKRIEGEHAGVEGYIFFHILSSAAIIEIIVTIISMPFNKHMVPDCVTSLH